MLRPPVLPIRRVALALLLVACGPGADGPPRDAATETDAHAGRLVIIGGALQADNDPVYDAILAGLDGPGPLCVLPTASGSPGSSMESAVERFRSRAPDRTVDGILLTVDNAREADDPSMADRLRACAGFYFTGGDQARILDVFRPGSGDTEAYRALMERWREGAVVAGTSAGAAMMSTPSIGGGSSAEALEHGVRRTGEGDGVWVRPGMDLVEWGIVDQHFLARGRWGRLLVAIRDREGVDRGVGIDENTALVMDGPTGQVVGASGVVWIQEEPEPGTFRLVLLGRGDRITPATGTFEPAPEKRALVEPLPGDAPTVQDPFRRWGLLHALEALARTPDASLSFTHEAGVLRLEKVQGFVALRDDGAGVEGAAPGLTVGPVRVVLEPAPPASGQDG